MWEYIPFENCLEKTKIKFKLPKKDYRESGEYPIVSQEENLISGYHDDISYIFKVAKPIVVFGDHTLALKYIDFDFIVGADGVKILQPKKTINSKYFYYVLKALMPKTTGYARHYKLLKKLDIPVPPLAEQERIVAKLDAAFAEIDEAVEKAQAKEKEIKKFKNSILTSMLNNNDWEDFKLAEICTKITDGSHNPPKGVSFSDFLMLSSKNVFDDAINFEKPRFLKEEDYIKENKRTNVQEGDVLLTIVGTIGRCAVVNDSLKPFTLQRSVAVLKPAHDLVLSRFLMYVLQDMLQILLQGARGVAQKGIYLKSLRELKLKVPPLLEQRSIITKLDAIYGQVDSFKDCISNNKENYKALKSAILSQELQPSEAA